MLQIKRGNNDILSVNPDIASFIQKQRNGIDYVSVSFPQITNSPMDLDWDDHIEVLGTKYFIISRLPTINKEAERRYDYQCVFEAEHYKMKRVKYFFLNANNQLKEKAFTVTGNLETFVGLLLLNLDRDNKGKWEIGIIDSTEFQNLSFDNQNCLEAIATLVSAFKTEFWMEGNKMNFTSKSKDSGLIFSYGKGNGLYSMTRVYDDDLMPITRLFVYGGSRNLPDGYRNYATSLQRDEPLELLNSGFPLNEETVTFDDVYPKYLATVTAVSDEFTFWAQDLPFNVNDQLLPGVTPKVIFQTGMLAGYTIEISSYEPISKQFVLKEVETERSMKVPSEINFADVGDIFIIVDMEMPEVFVTEAEDDLGTFGMDYFNLNNFNRAKYTVAPDRLNFKQRNIQLTVGDSVKLIDSGLGIDRTVPIESFKQYFVISEFSYEMQLSDYPIVDLATRLIREQIKQSNAGNPKPPIQSPKVYPYTRSKIFTRNNCTGSLVGSQVGFSRKYISNVSMADAENMANLDNANFDAAGQLNANTVGVCTVPKPINFIRVQQVSMPGDIAEFTIVADHPVKSDLTILVAVTGSDSGITQTGTATIAANTTTASGFTSNSSGSFYTTDEGSGTIANINPNEDSVYRYSGA
ncbi:DUF5977 domain-containing protein [Pedobacter sp. AW1-32]|uniref:DUF5977 domain-containing protein n=1 Tax=Pedobacter sp. AW1-32 TaxID=3383026 RepID=UPI003FEFE75D